MARNYDNETKLDRESYKRYTFKARRREGEPERLEEILAAQGRDFASWIRWHIHQDAASSRQESD